MDILQHLQNGILCLDGGMGTLLQAKGLLPGEAPEIWNLTHPEIIEDIHRAYFDAGSNVVNTNTFGANSLHFSESELCDIISAAVNNAKAARARSVSEKDKFIALDIGPTGRLLKPYGDLDFEEAVKVFALTVRMGVRCGVDLITVETMNDSYETKAALLAVKENSSLPVFVTNAYGDDGKLMTGASPEAMAAMLCGMKADAIGLNCSLGPAQLAPIAEKLLKHSKVPVIFKPNAGLPRVCGGKTVYDISPKEFAEITAELVKKGVRVIGGCCGTTPEYIKELCSLTDGIAPSPMRKINETVISSYTHTVDFSDPPVLIGERINPTGKKRFRAALTEHDMGYILREGISQAECGAAILDVNVGLPDIDEASLLTETVEELQAVTDLPLQIDTSCPEAMERALRRYNGKALINSVNGKEESMKAIFPLVQKYGGVVVALTLDENGIPSDADGRYKIAEKIKKTAESYGIGAEDLIFDTLAMTVSADKDAASVTLEALHKIKTELGCHTSLGISNVSFGLPCRDAVNSTFFACALEMGLSAAIMNPYSAEMMKTYRAYRMLHGKDVSCAEYISFCETLPSDVQSGQVISASKSKAEDAETISAAVCRGLKAAARSLTEKALETEAPLDIIERELIPALDKVGKGFEEKTVFLPQLLMSAEAAQSAFEVIKTAFPSQSSEKSMKVILATVKGDIHDIGKNIVRLLLENYGFDVYDLGKDVSPELILKETLRLSAPLVGLSALMTTTVPAMEETIKLLREKAPLCRIVVGGAVLDKEYAEKIGADRYASDAMETVRYAESIRDEIK